MSDRPPNHFSDTESNLLACLLLDERHFDSLQVRPSQMQERNGAILQAIIELRNRSVSVDGGTLFTELEASGTLDKAGGYQRIHELLTYVPHAELFGFYQDGFLKTRKRQTHAAFGGVDIADLEDAANEPVDWIVENVFSSDQPTLFGARSKCLKTTQLVDLSVALATETPWLGEFTIPKQRKVLLITGEANQRAIGRRLAKACAARGLSLSDLESLVRVEAVDFPKLPSIEDCEKIRRAVDQHEIDVLILDPLYRGLGNIDAHRMNEVGDAIVYFTQCCQPASVIISHHVIKSSARLYGAPPELEDMSGAGIAESCGNWWLVGRNAKYDWDWKHDLCVAYGGRDEQAGARRILFDESDWTAETESLHAFLDAQASDREHEKATAKQDEHFRKLEAARMSVIRVMKAAERPLSKNAAEQLRGVTPQTTWRQAFAEMIEDQTLSEATFEDSRKRTHTGWVLRETGSNEDPRASHEHPQDDWAADIPSSIELNTENAV